MFHARVASHEVDQLGRTTPLRLAFSTKTWVQWAYHMEMNAQIAFEGRHSCFPTLNKQPHCVYHTEHCMQPTFKLKHSLPEQRCLLINDLNPVIEVWLQKVFSFLASTWKPIGVCFEKDLLLPSTKQTKVQLSVFSIIILKKYNLPMLNSFNN